MITSSRERDLNKAIYLALDFQERENWGNRPVPMPYFLNYLTQCGVPHNRATFTINLLVRNQYIMVVDEGLRLVR